MSNPKEIQEQTEEEMAAEFTSLCERADNFVFGITEGEKSSMSISKQEMQEFDKWYAEKRKDPAFVAELEEMNNRMMVKTMWQNAELEDKLTRQETAKEELRASLAVILGAVDYTSGNVGATEMVCAALPKELIEKARKALAG